MNSLRSKSLLSTPTVELKGWTGPPLNKVRGERDYSAQKEAAGNGGALYGANVFVHSRLLTGEVLDVWTRGNQCTCKGTSVIIFVSCDCPRALPLGWSGPVTHPISRQDFGLCSDFAEGRERPGAEKSVAGYG